MDIDKSQLTNPSEIHCDTRSRASLRTLLQVTGASALLVPVLACSGEVEGVAGGEPDVAEAHEAIRGGELVREGDGAVWIDFESGGRCSGALISDNAVLTAAHCMNHVTNGAVEGVKIWTTHNSQLVCISSNDCSNFRSAKVTRNSHYRDWWDVSHDYGVVVLSSGSWSNITDGDYVDIYADTAKAVLSFDALGYGANSYDGTGTGTLRHADRYMNVYDSDEFSDTKIAGAYRLCDGDSGSPAFAQTSTFDGLNRILLGTYSAHSEKAIRKTHPVCSKENDTERWHRTESAIADISEWIGRPCSRNWAVDVNGNLRKLNRCWVATDTVFLHAPNGDFSQAHSDYYAAYLAWDNSKWCFRYRNGTFLHAPSCDWSQAHSDSIINYVTWDGSLWTARGNANSFEHAPNGDFSRSHTGLARSSELPEAWGTNSSPMGRVMSVAQF